MRKVLVSLSLVSCLLISSLWAASFTESIRLNQVGFYPEGPKMAIVVESSSEKFYILKSDLSDTVFTGILGESRRWQYSNENVKQAIFTEYESTGSYVCLVPDLGYSHEFDIKPRVHQEVARASIKSYYFQRMSIDLPEEFAGKWFRPMGHPDTEVLVHASAATDERPEGTIISCPRGWYDAGDFNKYIVNSGISTYQILAAYEHFPEYTEALNLNIPESGNTIPDLLDEALWNLRWMLTMQDPNDGGVYHKCTHANFQGILMPHEANAPRYVVRKSSTAALDFTAVMAQASRILQNFETEFPGLADTCLTAARASWKWARKHPDTYYGQNSMNQQFDPNVTTGAYDDSNDDDEFRWAAAEMYVTTGEDSFIVAVDPLSDTDPSVPGWRGVGTLGLYSLAHHRKNLTAAIDTTVLKNRLIQLADGIHDELAKSAYHVLLTTFPWGSNGVAANQSMALLQAYKLTGESKYLDGALHNVDYMLGRNATTYCFVSDHGDKPPMNFHHRQSEADDIPEPIPGLIAGGPNPSQQDNCPGYPSDLPAKSYVDDWCSYASNEICINWNAPLVYVTTAIEAIKSSSGNPVDISIQITEPTDGQSIGSSEIITVSFEASISEGTIVKVELFADGKKIGETTGLDNSINWENAKPGVYQLTAKAIGDQGDFLNSEAVEITVESANSIGNILFVVGDVDLNDGDYAIRKKLIENDYQVTLQDDGDAPFLTENMDVILVSSTVVSVRDIRNDLTEINIPLISWEFSLFDDFGWTGRKRDTDYGLISTSSFDIFDPAHPIAEGLSGTLKVCNSDNDLVWGLPNENADIVSNITGNADQATIFVYETGSVLLKGLVAMARRVGLFFSHETAADLTEEGWKIFLQSVAWASSGEVMAVETNSENTPLTTMLNKNYPNPFNPATQISYSLAESGDISLTVFNSVGQRVKTLFQGPQSAGTYRITWDGSNNAGERISNGLYYYQLKTDGNFCQTRKMIVLK